MQVEESLWDVLETRSVTDFRCFWISANLHVQIYNGISRGIGPNLNTELGRWISNNIF